MIGSELQKDHSDSDVENELEEVEMGGRKAGWLDLCSGSGAT